MSRELFEQFTEDSEEGLLEIIAKTDGALDELFETGSLTIAKNGKPYVLVLDVQEASE